MVDAVTTFRRFQDGGPSPAALAVPSGYRYEERVILTPGRSVAVKVYSYRQRLDRIEPRRFHARGSSRRRCRRWRRRRRPATIAIGVTTIGQLVQRGDAMRDADAEQRRRSGRRDRQSTTASIRNCSRMSRPRAPTAMRMPISRVRSVTARA